jgi:hypothetical protein
MNEKLKEAQKVFEIEKYKKKAMPEALNYLKEYKATGKYPYNAQVVEYIMERETIDADLKDYLDTEVYLAQHDLRSEKEEEQEVEMRKEGYIPLKEVGNFTGKCLFTGKRSLDWLTNKVDMEGKIIKAHNGAPFFIPKGKRTRGYYLAGIDNGFYKPLN